MLQLVQVIGQIAPQPRLLAWTYVALGGEHGDNGIQGKQLIEIPIPLQTDAGDGNQSIVCQRQYHVRHGSGKGRGAGLMRLQCLLALRVIDSPGRESVGAETEAKYQKKQKDQEYILGRSFGLFGYTKTDLREIAIRNRFREGGMEKAKKQALKKLRERCLDSTAWKLRRARRMVNRAASLEQLL